jgi:type II secretory pathway pseudopilin PulG
MHSDSDSNPYDNQAPIPNPYETPGYGAPPPDAKPDNYGQSQPAQQGNPQPPQQPPYPATPQQSDQTPPQQPPYPQQPSGDRYPPQQGYQYPPQQPPYSPLPPVNPQFSPSYPQQPSGDRYPPQQGYQYPPQQPPYPQQPVGNPQQGYQYPPQQPSGSQYPPSQGSAPTVYGGPYSQPGAAPQNTPYQYPNAPLPQYNQGSQLPVKRPMSGARIALLVLIALIVIFAAVAAITIPAHNAQVASTNATATAQSNAHSTATARANANATATAQTIIYATATAVASTYPFSNNVQLNDPMSDNTKGNGWEESSNCAFTGGAYHVTEATDNTFFTCSALKSNFKNFTYQATMQFKKGDVGAITFRGDTAQQHFYSYVVGNDGSYALFVYTKPNTKPQTLREGNAQFAAKQSLQVGVVARGSQIGLYINGQSVGSVSDSTYSSGQIGMAAYNTSGGEDIAFTNAQVWGL